MDAFRHNRKLEKSLIFSHLAILLTLSNGAYAEPAVQDQLSFDSDGGLKYEANISVFGNSSGNSEPRGGRILPPAKYSPPTSFTDSDTFFKSIGKQENVEGESSRRRR